MPHSKEHLNEKQVAVLLWIARGAPAGDYQDGDFAHRVTARALASRGLVLIKGRGRSWRAELTPDGRTKADELKSIAQAPADDERDIRTLIARLDDAGGRLEIDDRTEPVELWPIVEKANRSSLRPHGLQFDLSAARWQSPWLRVLTYTDQYWDLVDAPEVEPVAERARLGALARAFLKSRDDQFVSKDSLPRAARVLEAIVRHATKHGMTVRDPRAVDAKRARNNEYTRGWSGHIEIESGATAQRVQVREAAGPSGGKFDYNRGFLQMDRAIYDRVERLPRWQRNRGYWFAPTGRLELRINRPGFGFDTGNKRYADTKTLTVEDRLGEVFRYIEVTRLEQEAANHRAELAKVRRAEQWEAAMIAARLRFREHQEETLLVEQAQAWRRHQDVVAFVEELRSRDPEAGELRRWISIGETVARRLDPYEGLAEPDLVEPTLEDLKPFLRGWSPYGPEGR